jgi:hypothetical protein
MPTFAEFQKKVFALLENVLYNQKAIHKELIAHKKELLDVKNLLLDGRGVGGTFANFLTSLNYIYLLFIIFIIVYT